MTVIPGRREAASPESITAIVKGALKRVTCTVSEYGFRARGRWPRPGMTHYIPASQVASAPISGSVTDSMRSCMPGLLARAPVRKSVMVFAR